MISISDAFSSIADHARFCGIPLPIIVTDGYSARALVCALEDDIGAPRGEFQNPNPGPRRLIGMFNGIMIISDGTERLIAPRPNPEWREYFGDLADIWSE